MPSAGTVAEMAVVVTADVSQAEAGLTSLGTKVSGIGSTLGTLATGAAVGGIAALGAAFVGSVASAADFEQQLSAISAVSGATTEDLDGIRTTALQLGKDTSFSAKEAANGMEEMVKAGVSLDDVIGGGARAALDLAAAGAVSVGDAAEIASNAMNVFSLKGSDMAHVADVIAGAANVSAISVTDYKFSLSAAGAVAATVGVGFEDLSTAIAAMGNAGIKGSDAGTSLKTMLMNLQPSTNAQRDEFRRLVLETTNLQAGLDGVRKLGIEPLTNDWPGLNAAMMKHIGLSEDVSKWSQKDHQSFEKLERELGAVGSAFFDTNGKAKSMADIAGVLQTATEGMTEAQKLASLEILFGSDAIRAAAVLSKEGAAGMEELAAGMGKVTAQAVATERLNNLNGSLEQLKGSLETMAITVGMEFLPILKDFVDAMTQAANEAMPSMEAAAKDVAAAIKEWGPTVKAAAGFLWDNREAIAAVVVALGTFVILTTVIGWITTAIAAFSAITAAISASGGVIAALTGLVALLGGPVTLVLIAIAAAAGVLYLAWSEDWGGIQEATQGVIDFLVTLPETIGGIMTDCATAVGDFEQAVADAWTAIADGTTAIWNGIATFLTTWWREILVALTGPVGLVAVFILDHWQAIADGIDLIQKAISNILTAAWDLLYTSVIQPKVEAIETFITGIWEAIKLAIEAAMAQVQTVLTTAWDAIKLAATTVLDALLAYIRDTIFEPIRAAVEASINAARDLFGAAVQAVSDAAHRVMDPLVSWWNETIWGPIKTAVETASTAVSTAFETAVGAVKTTVDTVMSGAHAAWMTMWGAIETAARSPADALKTVTDAVEKLKDVMPEWLIPHSPTPFEQGIRGIADAVGRMQARMSSFSSGLGDVPGELDDWLKAAIAHTGVGSDWLDGLRWIAMHESTGNPRAENPDPPYAKGLMQTIPPTFAAYRDKGLPDDIFNPVANAAAAIRYIKDVYDGDLAYIIQNWARRGGYAEGGWAGLHGPELAMLGERGPEYVIPNHALRRGGGIATQSMTINVAIGGRVAEQIYVEGRDLAIRRGRAPAGVA
jgi:phage-related protein